MQPNSISGRSGAHFDPTRSYRYSLWRYFEEQTDLSQAIVFIGLNPSTADETIDDPTIRRCQGFAKRWGYQGMVMLNLFALRATQPKQMKRSPSPIGSENDEVLLSWSCNCGTIVCCWGMHGSHLGRSLQVKQLLQGAHLSLWHLGLTRSGEPRHPLYLPARTPRVRW